MALRAVVIGLAGLLFVSAPLAAQTLGDAMAGVAFLIGDWTGGGKTGSGMTDKGTSSMHLIVGGNALLRRDHNDVTDADGKLQQSFDQIMLIYPEGGTLRADYLDGAHTIHYTHATVTPGSSVEFDTTPAKGVPDFRLTYIRATDSTLSVLFEMKPTGAAAFTRVAAGTLTRK